MSIIGAVVVWWLARNKARFGGGHGYAIDPVCAMQVRIEDAPSRFSYAGELYYFCSDRCRERFEARPERFTMNPTNIQEMSPTENHDSVTTAIDPICGMTVDIATAAAHRSFNGTDVWFCNPGCAATFDTDPGRYVVSGHAHDDSQP
ncbi:MAG: hypothetical protein B7X03_02615 [Parcubacteria group bacterium 21-58-10]|nr:MAG: hypothetical protein B7X03_02615 [Parcubacteria group bacterium 21-58-10]